MKESKKAQKRRKILECAEEVMRRDGLNKFSMDAIVKEADIAKGTLYLYFKSKEDLLAQVTVKAREDLLRRFKEETGNKAEHLDKVRAILWTSYHFYKEKELYNDLVAYYEVNRNLEDTDALQEVGERIQLFVLSILDNAKQAGHVKKDTNTATLSLMMWGMSNGILNLIDTKDTLLQKFTGKTKQTFYHSFIELVIDSIRS